MINRCVRSLFGVCTFLILLTSVTFAAEIYHGKVVDEETGEPLAGASVTVIWYKTPIVQLEGSLYFQSAQETVTDREGKFSLEVAPGVDWNPFTTIVKKHHIVVFKPGYVPFSPNRMPKELWVEDELVRAAKIGIIVKLQKLKTESEGREFTDLSSIGVARVEHKEIPRLMRNLEIQRKLAGLRS